MSEDTREETPPFLRTPTPNIVQQGRVVNERFLVAARIPFLISLVSVISMLSVFLLQTTYPTHLDAVLPEDSPIIRFLIPNAIYIGLFIIALVTGYVGYRLIVAAGATTAVVIPPQDYELLAPLIAHGKADSIDQYVRLSSLATFTGSFTQLGLTGLPLATIGLTLFFSFLALFHPDGFLDLTKLTLGAFIGSFVQRQVERRADGAGAAAAEPSGEAVTPAAAR